MFKKVRKPIFYGAITGLIIVAGIFALKLYFHGKFPPGTTVSGISISMKTPDETAIILEDAANKYLNTPLEITLGNTTAKLTPGELGIEIMVDQTLQIIKETSAADLSLMDIIRFTKSPATTINILTKLDHDKLIAALNERFSLPSMAPKSATFYFDEKSKLQIKEHEKGKILNLNPLIKTLKTSAKQLTPQKITLLLIDVTPAVTKEILEAQKEEITQALRHKFAMIDPIYSDDWEMQLTDHLDWVEFEQPDEITKIEDIILYTPTTETLQKISIKIKQEKLDEFIDAEISKWLDRPPEQVNIFTDENGEVVIEGKGKDGLEVQRHQLKKAVELAVQHSIHDVPIPVIEIEPKIIVSDDLKELGIEERIGVGHTSYYRSPANRVHNIKVGSSKFNGKLIAPGETFSFNQNLGKVDGSTGYKKELVIKQEGTIPEYGGGICQVSTTVYRAAIFTGLPIAERNQHSYAVSYYSQVLGHGLDATIYLGGADLKFTNDTGNHILIQTFTENDYELYIIFYGTSDGRSVEMEGPYLSNYHYAGGTEYIDTTEIPAGQTKQVEKRHTGFDALWYRYISFPDKETIIEKILTKYKAVPDKIWVGVEE